MPYVYNCPLCEFQDANERHVLDHAAAVHMLDTKEAVDHARRTLAKFATTPDPVNHPMHVDISAGVKYDADKLPLDLLDPVALEGVAAVLQFGAKKYAAHNWRGGLKYSRLIAALLRHMFAIIRGEDIDPESGLPHIDHVGCCWMFLSNMMKTRKDLDDRWKNSSVARTAAADSAGTSNT